MTKQVVEKTDYLIDLHGGDLDDKPAAKPFPTGRRPVTRSRMP